MCDRSVTHPAVHAIKRIRSKRSEGDGRLPRSLALKVRGEGSHIGRNAKEILKAPLDWWHVNAEVPPAKTMKASTYGVMLKTITTNLAA